MYRTPLRAGDARSRGCPEWRSHDLSSPLTARRRLQVWMTSLGPRGSARLVYGKDGSLQIAATPSAAPAKLRSAPLGPRADPLRSFSVQTESFCASERGHWPAKSRCGSAKSRGAVPAAPRPGLPRYRRRWHCPSVVLAPGRPRVPSERSLEHRRDGFAPLASSFFPKHPAPIPSTPA